MTEQHAPQEDATLPESTVLASESEGILTLTISRPRTLNALSPQVIADLRAAVRAVQARVGAGSDWSIRGVILTGAGEKAFVAGADIKQMREMSRAESDAFARDAQELTSWLEELPVPVIAAVHGFALGGGCELALACDFIYASETARFGQPEVALGLIPGFGGTVRLQHAVGRAQALELIMTGRQVRAQEALTLGLVNRVLPDQAALLEAAHTTLLAVSKQSPLAVGVSKRVIQETAHLDTQPGLEVELAAFASCFESEDMREGTAAFVEKRAAQFTGR